MTEKSKLGLKPGSPVRNPQRRPVRGGPMPPTNQPAGRRGQPPTHNARAMPVHVPAHVPAAAPLPAPAQQRPAVPSSVRPAVRPSVRPSAPPSEGVRLSKILSDRGQASRREADDWIAEGWVRVNGRPAVLGQRIRGDEHIEIDTSARQQQRQQVTVLINKPIGFVSGQAEDGYEPASVLVTPANRWSDDRGLPWRPSFGRHLAPAGRLDIDSTGMLVLTQDGRVARHLIGEDSNVEKEYLVRVEPLHPGSFQPEGIEWLREGLVLDEQRLKPAKVSWANEDQLRFVLREGRKRQIRRMCELVGLKVVGLKRVRIGQVVLGKLPLGQWRLLRDDERF